MRADAEGAALSILEDDCLVKDEDFRDCLDQGLKCETDRWEGHATWLGPKAVEHFFTFDDLPDKEDFPAECALVHKDAHFVPFWHNNWGGGGGSGSNGSGGSGGSGGGGGGRSSTSSSSSSIQ